MPTPGHFVWYDLITRDVQGAKAFYGEVIGWTTKQWEEGDYLMWMAGETPVGGILELPTQADDATQTPYWLGYVACDDVDAVVRRAKELRADVLVEPENIPKAGRLAVLRDPHGARFAVYKASLPPQRSQDPAGRPPGHMSWAELHSPDWRASFAFYSELFAWKSTKTADKGPPFGEYAMFGAEPHRAMGGMCNMQEGANPKAHWLYSTNVEDVRTTATRVTRHGGKVLTGPMEIPSGDTIAHCADPQGAVFAIYASAQALTQRPS